MILTYLLTIGPRFKFPPDKVKNYEAHIWYKCSLHILGPLREGVWVNELESLKILVKQGLINSYDLDSGWPALPWIQAIQAIRRLSNSQTAHFNHYMYQLN